MLASPSISITGRSGLCDLRPGSGWQTEAHRAHTARGQPQTRLAKIEVLRRPHLVLADAGRDDRAPLSDAIDGFDDVVWLNQRAVAIVVHRVLTLQCVRYGRSMRRSDG